MVLQLIRLKTFVKTIPTIYSQFWHLKQRMFHILVFYLPFSTSSQHCSKAVLVVLPMWLVCDYIQCVDNLMTTVIWHWKIDFKKNDNLQTYYSQWQLQRWLTKHKIVLGQILILWAPSFISIRLLHWHRFTEWQYNQSCDFRLTAGGHIVGTGVLKYD